MKKFIKAIPMATPGLALGLAALGNLLNFPVMFEHAATIRYICGVLAVIVLLIFALKLIFDWPHAREELKTPVPLSVLPTATMAIMLLATYIRPHVPEVALVVWYTGLVVHVLIMLLFIWRFVIGFKLGTVFPSWFIVAVGIVTASVTAPAMGALHIGQIIFYVGLVLYIITLSLVIVRMNKVRVFPEPARKTVAIFTAPAALLTVGYFSSFISQGQGVPQLVYVLVSIATLCYIYVCFMIIVELRKIDFYPTYAAFTFPLVISALAFRLGANFLVTRYSLYFLPIIANVTMWIAVAAVVFVVLHYIKYFRFWLKF
ncbi:MAG: TDT family transporter [Defluviitaleaceae bacterium]|nr:TDT family transporter [Defluviitaleaceae bacterium]